MTTLEAAETYRQLEHTYLQLLEEYQQAYSEYQKAAVQPGNNEALKEQWDQLAAQKLSLDRRLEELTKLRRGLAAPSPSFD